MMSFVRRPTGTARAALGVVSVALAGVVIAKACSIIVDDDSSSPLKFAVEFVVVMLSCAVVGAIITAVRGVIVRAVFGFDLVVAVGIVVVGTVIGGLIGSAHDSGLVHDGGIVYGGLVGCLAGAFVAFGGLADSICICRGR